MVLFDDTSTSVEIAPEREAQEGVSANGGLPSARHRAPTEMSCRPWQCLVAIRLLTTRGIRWILQPIRISLVVPSQEIGRPGFVASYGGSL